MYKTIKQVVFIIVTGCIAGCTGEPKKSPKTQLVDTTIKTVDTAKTATIPSKDADQPYNYSGPVHTDAGVYVDLDANGDNELLIVAHGSDTATYINESSKNFKLKRGDSIRVYWKAGTYRPAGDPEYPVKAIFATNYELIKPGKLSQALKAGMPRINYYYYDDQTSDYAKGVIHDAVKYYLVNTKQPEIRQELDYHKRNLLYTVERKTIQDREAWIISIHVDGPKPQPIHTVYYFFETPYVLYDNLESN